MFLFRDLRSCDSYDICTVKSDEDTFQSPAAVQMLLLLNCVFYYCVKQVVMLVLIMVNVTFS